uniref:Uncharacterized protein n=1 Tax=Romanomermis culicivorax TaxID=13658 RepID=A0A915KD58_ROMCU
MPSPPLSVTWIDRIQREHNKMRSSGRDLNQGQVTASIEFPPENPAKNSGTVSCPNVLKREPSQSALKNNKNVIQRLFLFHLLKCENLEIFPALCAGKNFFAQSVTLKNSRLWSW